MNNYEAKLLHKGRRKRKRTEARKKFVKIIFCVFVSILLLIAISISAFVFLDIKKSKNELKILTEENLVNQVEVEKGRSINLSTFGTGTRHTIVPIADIGVQDFTVHLKHLFNDAQKDVTVALMDRAGNGVSEDSEKEQTVEQIISDYKIALINAGLNAPYVLVANGFGGVYATYWANTYPEDIEGIVYLQGTPIIKDTKPALVEPDTNNDLLQMKLGFYRLSDNKVYNFPSKILNNQESECSRCLNLAGYTSKAQISEATLMEHNYKVVAETMKQNTIPKIYVSSLPSIRTVEEAEKYIKHKNEINAVRGLPPLCENVENEAVLNEATKQLMKTGSKELEEKIKPFVESLGNCLLTEIPGDTKIYEQKPGSLPGLFTDFLLHLEGENAIVAPMYEDENMIKWEKYRDSHDIQNKKE